MALGFACRRVWALGAASAMFGACTDPADVARIGAHSDSSVGAEGPSGGDRDATAVDAAELPDPEASARRDGGLWSEGGVDLDALAEVDSRGWLDAAPPPDALSQGDAAPDAPTSGDGAVTADALGPADLVPGSLGEAFYAMEYSAELLAQPAPSGPYSFAVVAGTLPPGLTLQGAKVSGIPSQEGDFRFDIELTGAVSAVAPSARRSYTLHVNRKRWLVFEGMAATYLGDTRTFLLDYTADTPTPIPLGSNAIDVVNGRSPAHAFSPNGRWIACGDAPTPHAEHFAVVVADLSGRTIHPSAPLRGSNRVQTFSWSPDSSTLAFAEESSEATFDVYAVRLADAGPSEPFRVFSTAALPSLGWVTSSILVASTANGSPTSARIDGSHVSQVKTWAGVVGQLSIPSSERAWASGLALGHFGGRWAVDFTSGSVNELVLLDEEPASWSPGFDAVASYPNALDGLVSLYRVERDGTVGAKQVVLPFSTSLVNSPQLRFGGPTWARQTSRMAVPDGTRLAFVTFGASSELVLHSMDMGKPVLATNFAPSDEWLAVEFEESDASYGTSLVHIDGRTGAPTLAAERLLATYDCRFSPSSRLVACAAGRGSVRVRPLDASGVGPERVWQVPVDWEYTRQWSGDSSTVGFVGGGTSGISRALVTMDVHEAGSTPRILADKCANPIQDVCILNMGPTFQP